MDRRHFLTVMAGAALSVALLAGCGSASSAPASSAAPEKSLADIRTAIEEANTISNPFELGETNIKLDFLLSLDDVAEYTGVMSNDNDNAGLILVVKCADGKVDTVKAALEEYKASQTAYFGNYPEFADALANVEAGTIETSGNIAVITFASSEGKGSEAVASAVTEALK